MQEQLNTTMASLSETVGQDVPTLAEVQQKIEQRYAKASAAAELEGTGVEAKMLEVETAAMNTEAQARLEQIRSQLGLAAEPAAEPAPAAQSEPAPQSEPAQQPQPQPAPAEPPA